MKKRLLIFAFIQLSFISFSQTTYTVNSPADLPDINLNDSFCGDSQGNCTLRAAMQNANKTSNKDSIEFDISGNAPFVITVTDVLPPIAQPLIIDGRTQLDYINSPIIEIDGSTLAGTHNGIQLIGSSEGSEIYGLSIGGFKRMDIYPYSFGMGMYAITGNHIIQSNYVGLKPDGSTINSNTGGGLYFNNTGGNQIGGILANQGNVISGNLIGGVTFEGTPINSAASNNSVQGNLIGTDATGTLVRGNTYNVQFLNAYNNTLGGNSIGARNIISGSNSATANNVGTGIALSGPECYGNKVIGNYIGTDITGTQSLPNVRGGVFMLFGAHDNEIGTDQAGEGNIISGNGLYGIYSQGGETDHVDSNSIKGNYIGVDVTGNVALPNGKGIVFNVMNNNNNIIGGTTANSRNIISGNTGDGISINNGNNNQIIGNYIGTNAEGTAAIANDYGLYVAGGNTTIGGQTAGSRNIISGNNYGIYISESTSNGSSIKGNYIGLNATGTGPIANSIGLTLSSTSTNCVVGGDNPLDRNIISGNSYLGMYASGTANVIKNNYVGLNPEGDGVIGNEKEGIRFYNTLTDTEVSENTISGNGTIASQAFNVYFLTANGLHFFNNKIGTLPDGNTGVTNLGTGIGLFNSSNNTIGGLTAAEGNIIGSHNNNAIILILDSNNNVLSYNKIGVGLDGVTSLGNGFVGIGIFDANVNNAITHNIIANNQKGVSLSPSPGFPTQVTISENSIFNNSVIGIDLVGATANDVSDADTGPNNLQNTPEVSSIIFLGEDVIEITYAVPSSIANSAYPLVIEFFGADNGQGKLFIDADVYTATGVKTITLNLPTGFDVNDYNNIVATATDANGNTSEFGINVNYPLSVSQFENNRFKLYPNPVSNVLFIKSPVSEAYNLELINTLGQVVLTQKNNNASIELKVSSLSNGLYFLNITSERGTTEIIKFIKN
ncbi:T9SS type A sorting domain-containing protein [Winogradskyella psychrotolerans]|uniref:T9SS type A sorting domain-containing protein n=1 Tax=Winogradskyella psychrotolerans TaxID=1344585 RepID=UPI00040B7673|nr:T9SS type A sorting domain-containing protein [Winogradskyella psychrotolerans]